MGADGRGSYREDSRIKGGEREWRDGSKGRRAKIESVRKLERRGKGKEEKNQ